MGPDELGAYCLGKPGAEETYPCGEGEPVAKVGGKGFAFIGLAGSTVSVNCGRDAAEAGEWRDRYPAAVRHSRAKAEPRALCREGALGRYCAPSLHIAPPAGARDMAPVGNRGGTR